MVPKAHGCACGDRYKDHILCLGGYNIDPFLPISDIVTTVKSLTSWVFDLIVMFNVHEVWFTLTLLACGSLQSWRDYHTLSTDKQLRLREVHPSSPPAPRATQFLRVSVRNFSFVLQASLPSTTQDLANSAF